MKSYLNSFSFTIIIFVILIGSMNVNGANKPYLLSKDYCTLTTKFFAADTILIVMPDACTLSESDRSDMENAVQWEKVQSKPVYVYKTETEVATVDFKKHILLYGCFNKFKRKEFLRIPVRKQSNGFRFENHSFTGPTDAFFYVNKKADRMYLCKNSDRSHHQFFSIGGTAYPLHVFRDSTIVITGVY